MSQVEAALYLVYALVVLLPLLPGLLELRTAADDDPLKIDAAYARDPRFLGKSMRAKVVPILEETEGEARVPFLNRKNEFAIVTNGHASLDRERFENVVLSRGGFRVGDHSTMLDVYARGDVEVGAHAQLRTFAADRGASFGSRTNVMRWIDVEGDCRIGDASDLGQSVSAAGRLILGTGVRFNRLFGRPIAVVDGRRAELRALETGPLLVRSATSRRLLKSVVVDPETRIEGDVIATGDVEVCAGAVVAGSIKAGGTVVLRERACVFGNVVARGTVTLACDATILGHIFGESDVVLHAGALVGDRHAPKTIHASRGASIASEACIFGWLIAERGGITLADVDHHEES